MSERVMITCYDGKIFPVRKRYLCLGVFLNDSKNFFRLKAMRPWSGPEIEGGNVRCWSSWRCLGKKTSGVGRDMVESGDFGGKTMRREHSFPGRSAKIYWHSGIFWGASGLQVSSRTRVRPSPMGISSGCQAGLWSNESGSESDGGLAWLNQFRSGSSSGIHSLTACHGGSMGSRQKQIPSSQSITLPSAINPARCSRAMAASSIGLSGPMAKRMKRRRCVVMGW